MVPTPERGDAGKESGLRILICGAGGNLGGLFAEHMLAAGFEVRLMWHQHPPAARLGEHRNAHLVQADMGDLASLAPALDGVDVAVHLAGRLFAPRPSRFLAHTNIGYTENLARAAAASGLGRLVFVSFPQVQGPSTPEHPATGRLDGEPISLHARTRLRAEQRLFSLLEHTQVEPVIVRSGAVYGPGVKLIETAHKLMSLGLMAVWTEPTWYHFIALVDFLRGLQAAVSLPNLRGVYPLGDDCPMRLQVFLDRLADHWGVRRPWRLPLFVFTGLAAVVELAALATHTPAPLTRDIIRLGRVDHSMDTRRMKSSLLPDLCYPSLDEGLSTL